MTDEIISPFDAEALCDSTYASKDRLENHYFGGDGSEQMYVKYHLWGGP